MRRFIPAVVVSLAFAGAVACGEQGADPNSARCQQARDLSTRRSCKIGALKIQFHCPTSYGKNTSGYIVGLIGGAAPGDIEHISRAEHDRRTKAHSLKPNHVFFECEE